MFETCRACLKSLNVVTSPYFQFDSKALSNIERDQFKTVIPEMDLNIPNQIFFCESCHTSLQTAYKFIIQCLRTEEIIKKYVDSKCVINLEDFDLKAVAFECGVIVEQEVVKDTTDKNVISADKQSASNQFEDLSGGLEIKDESDNITIVSHEVGNYFSNQEEVVPARNKLLYPDNDKVYKESVLYALLQNKTNNNTRRRLSNMNNKTVCSSVTNSYPLSHIIHNNIRKETLSNPYPNQYNDTNSSEINLVFQNAQNENATCNRKVEIQKHVTCQKTTVPISYHNGTMDKIMKNIERNTVNRDLLQINPVFENIPNHYIYKKRKLEEAEVLIIDDDDDLNLCADTSESKIINNVSSEEIIVAELTENKDAIEETLPPSELSLTEPFQGNESSHFPILNDIIDPQSLNLGPSPPDSDSSGKPETLSGVEVIPHLKKFFVCDICGKLLSTRFYAFHMKKH